MVVPVLRPLVPISLEIKAVIRPVNNRYCKARSRFYSSVKPTVHALFWFGSRVGNGQR